MKASLPLGALAAAFILLAVLAAKEAGTCRKGEGPEAIVSCSLLIKYIPFTSMKAGFLAERAARYDKAGMPTKALGDLTDLAGLTGSLSPERMLEAYNRLAVLNFKTGKLSEMRKYADLAVKNGSADPEVYLSRASVNLSRENYAEALVDLQKAESLGYKHPSLYFSLGDAYKGLGQYDKAYTTLKDALPLMTADGDKAQIARLLGLTCFEVKNYAESVQYLKQALDYGLNCPDCPAAIAMAQQLLDQQPAPAGKKRAPKGVKHGGKTQ